MHRQRVCVLKKFIIECQRLMMNENLQEVSKLSCPIFYFQGIVRYVRKNRTRMDLLTCVGIAKTLLPWIRKNGCKYCGIPMSGFDFNGLICAACRDDKPQFLKGKCMFLLDQNGKKVIHEIKYHGVKDVLKDLPRWLDRCGNYREFIEDSILVPVPLHKKRLKKRGFNQSSWIAVHS